MRTKRSPGDAIAEWTLELFEIPPPGFRAEDDILVVEDTASGRLVSSLCLIPQTWSYAGVPTSVGQPELVGTHPDYRRRGLVRAQFEVIHARSAELGQQWQIIGGIPWYYRQFGYSYALDLPPFPIWRWGKSQPEPPAGYSLRPAVAADIPFVAALDEAAATRSSLCCLRGVDGMTYEVTRRPGALPTGRILVLEQSRRGGAGRSCRAGRLRGPLVRVCGKAVSSFGSSSSSPAGAGSSRRRPCWPTWPRGEPTGRTAPPLGSASCCPTGIRPGAASPRTSTSRPATRTASTSGYPTVGSSSAPSHRPSRRGWPHPLRSASAVS